MDINTILFDADNTLIDYNKAEKYALKMAIKKAGIKFKKAFLNVYKIINKEIWIDYELGKITSEDLRVERFKRLFNKTKTDLDPLIFSKIYLEELTKTNFLIKDAKKILKRLSPLYTLGIITNGIKKVQEGRLKESGINHYFKTIICSEEVKIQKPDKRIFEITMSELASKDKDKIIMIGDSLSSDILGGINAGINTCWFNPLKAINKTEIKPDIEISNLKELLNLFN